MLVNAGAPVRQATPAQVGTASGAPAVGAADWPDVPPTQVGPQFSRPVCFSTTPDDPPGDAPWGVRISLPRSVDAPGQAAVQTATGEDTRVVVPRGAGALVRSSTSSGGDGSLTIVTDSGLRYALPKPGTAARLRYEEQQAVRVPAPFVALLAEGPTLDPDIAAREFTGR